MPAPTTAKTTMPVAPLKIIYLKGSEEIADAVNQYLIRRRRDLSRKNKDLEMCPGYLESTYLIRTHYSRFGTGEGRVRLDDSIRGTDLFIIGDVTNYTQTLKVCGHENHMSPDNYFQDIKRIISAVSGKAHRISVVLPFLYESRQHRRTSRESLDCAMALRELADYGVSNIITFDAHDPRVMDAIPLISFDNFMPTYQFLKALLKSVPDISFDKDHFMVISPDEGAMDRAVYFANILGADMGTFYKRRDYSKIVNGKNPIVAHEFLGETVEGKDCVVIDDMIASGGSMVDVCKQIKERGARRVFICTTFGLFTEGFDKFDEFYEKGYFDKLITTNLTYLPPELYRKPYFVCANMYKYMANIIHTLNHDQSISTIKSTTSKISKVLSRLKAADEQDDDMEA
ncbi:MAG: ribose-phosphate pyrophosphokinase [Lachnospiraceae bacterium]|jgi:ribose-phosphate pyrophosphokinase|nr:ribose-phosphate pyrophosphokinase [Lachnospiraceae bacterium]MEE3377349.1 ribose-phosphate pyrophosphokinase [Lachnospiraceae bacterium]